MSTAHKVAYVGLAMVNVLLATLPQVANACMANGDPEVRIVRSAENDEHAVAFVSSYSCAAMPPKTYCCIGIGFDQSDAFKKARIRIDSMHFVNAQTGQALRNFNPTRKEATGKSFENEKELAWAGYWALYRKDSDAEGLAEIRIDFTMAPGTTDADLKAAFANCHVGTSEGTKEGTVVKGEHHEVLKVANVRVHSLKKQQKAPSRDGKKEKEYP